MTRSFVYVSNAEDGTISSYELNGQTGRLAALASTKAGKNVMPMAVAPDRKHLYAVIRSEPYRVITFAINLDNGKLKKVGEAALPDSMCYASIDDSGRWLFTASYGGSRFAVSAISPSGLVEAEAHQVLPSGRHAHCIVPDRAGKSVYVSCLGSDSAMHLSFDAAAGRLLRNHAVGLPAGTGPRHIAVAPDNRFVYVLGELTGTVSQFGIDGEKGSPSFIARVDTIPPEAKLGRGRPRGGIPFADADRLIWCADIAITPDGRHLYTTERTQSRITQLRIDGETGTPRLITTQPTATQPRGIRIDKSGRFLIASGERSDHVRLYTIDQATGSLTEQMRLSCGKGANWVEIVAAD